MTYLKGSPRPRVTSFPPGRSRTPGQIVVGALDLGVDANGAGVEWDEDGPANGGQW